MINGRKIVLQSLVGNRNYNLTGEKQYKYFVLPTFDDFYNQTEHCVKNYEYDIRKLPILLWNANVNFLEVLFSIENTGNDELIHYLHWNRFELSKMNLPRLYTFCMESSSVKENQMVKSSPIKNEILNKFGYDPELACSAIRLLDFVKRLHDYHFNFEKALWYGKSSGNEIQKCFMNNILSGKYTLREINELIVDYREEAEKYYDDFFNQKTNPQHYHKLNDFIKELVRKECCN